jgi:hypothetical protein
VPEVAYVAPPARPELRRLLRERLRDVAPRLRILAEGLLGAGSPIDFVGVEPGGRTTLVLVGEASEDLELVARALAQRDWVAARLRDWLQLAPDLDLRPEAGVAVVLLCPSFRPESVAAARALAADAPRLATYRCLRNGAGVGALLEPLLQAQGEEDGARAEPPPCSEPSPFRTRLSDADLGLTAEELREFE